MSLCNKTGTLPKEAPAALIIPDVNSEMDAGHHSSPAPSRSSCRSTSLSTDYSPSPADPGKWEGASSLARFGLDIGGTLCKVVYFEPVIGLEVNTASGDFSSSNVTELAEAWNKKIGGMNGLRNEFGTTILDQSMRLEENGVMQQEHQDLQLESEKQKKHSEIWENKSKLKKDKSVSDSALKELDMEAQDKLTNVTTTCPTLKQRVDDNFCEVDSHEARIGDSGARDACHCGRSSVELVACDPIKSTLDRWMGENGIYERHTDMENCSHQVHKIWVSSHEPVFLPGRGTLYFKCFETCIMEEFLSVTKKHSLVTGGRALGATGGGARKFGHQFLEIAGLQLQRTDELRSLVRGIDFLVKHAQHESFEYPKGSFQGGIIQRPLKSPENSSDDGGSDFSDDESSSSSQLVEDESDLESCSKDMSSVRPQPGKDTVSMSPQSGKDTVERRDSGKNLRGIAAPKVPVLSMGSGGWLENNDTLYPYLVVNIGSGVSILRADSPDQFQRVGGTSLGGSTFFGLTSVLTGCNSFEEAIGLAASGDSTQIDMLVGDIYGGDYLEMGLAATTVASSFGKLAQPARRVAAVKTPQHLAKAALLMITNNIGSLAMLHARATGVDHVMFTGSFLHGNKLAMRLLAVAMEFWSKGQIKAIFLRHEGHAGAMGALLSALDPENPIDALLLG